MAIFLLCRYLFLFPPDAAMGMSVESMGAPLAVDMMQAKCCPQNRRPKLMA
jgi:hypothetical protein